MIPKATVYETDVVVLRNRVNAARVESDHLREQLAATQAFEKVLLATIAKIKAHVTGEAAPNWSDGEATYRSRGYIADLCEVTEWKLTKKSRWKMTDIVERLRADAESTDDIGLCAEAADVIENQRNRLEAYATGIPSDISRAMIKVTDEQRTRIAELERELAAETNNKQEFERDWLACCDKLNDERRIHLELEETLVKKLEATQAREEVLLEALNYCADNVPEFWTVPGVKAALNQPTDDTALKAAIQHGITEFLERTGQYVTNDASRKAALKAERERCINAIRNRVRRIVISDFGSGTPVEDDCVEAIRALEDI